MAKVLLVEDDKILSRTLTDEFTDAGFEVAAAFDGEEGLQSALEQKPDLVLLDIVMPKMDGMTMIKKLRESGEFGKRMPVVILTNLNVNDKIMKGITDDEPAYYLVKSDYTIEDVVAKVTDCLRETTPAF